MPYKKRSYYWRISAHIDAGANAGTWTSYTTANSFTISGNVNSTGGLYGTIYDTQVGNGIQGAVVTIINKDNNESKIAVTDADGFYSFSDIGGSGVWYMTVSATDYQGTSWQLPVDVSSTYERKDVALVKSANYFLPNYVTFSVTDIWLNQYSGVTATVYQSDLVIDTKQTDMYGKVQFKLDKNIEYTITFVDPTQNINTRRTIVPTDSMYWIVVWGATKNTDVNTSQDQNAEPAQLPRDSDYIKYGVGQATKNISYSYIVVGINATSSASNITGWSTSVAEVYPSNDTVMTDANNSTLNYSVTVVGFGNSTTKIEVPSGRTYKVYSQIASDKLSQPVYKQDFITITESGVRSDLDFGFEDQWNYEALGYACMLLIAGLFGQRSMNVGALLLILMGSFFTYERWFPSNAGTLMMNGLAIIAFVAYSMTRRD